MKTKRILATILAIAMLASFISVPVFAEEAVPTLLSEPVGEGYVCEDLGILVGPDEDGVTEEYLDTLAMRTQAAMVNLRLFGLEETALAFDGEATFEDAADATAYWQPILEYLKANPGMGWVGDEDGNFLPNEYITGQAFTKIILVALGYEYGLDFDWETTMVFAGEIGLTYLADKAAADLTVRDIAIAIIEALGFKTNSTTDVTLLTQLVLDGIIDETVATEAGFEVGAPTLAIVNAYPSSTDEVTIVLNMDLPEGTPITLKKGTAGFVVTEAVDGSTVTLTTLFELPVGTYTVMVGTETADFEVMTQYAVDLVITAESVYLAADQDLGVAMLDQYGDEMSLSLTNYSVFNQSSGYVFATTATTDLTIDVLSEPAEADEIIYVFVYDPVSMLTISAELPVLAAPVLTEIIIGDVTNGDEDAAMLFQDTSDNILDLDGIDQYGNEYEITFDDLMDGTIQYLLSNEDCIDMWSVHFIEGDLYFDSAEPGDFIFTFILPTTAFITTTEVLTIYPNPTLTSIEIAGPVEAVYAEEEITFPVVGIDQYGNVIDVTSGDDVMFTHTVDLTMDIGLEKSNDNSVYFWAEDAGTTTVYYFLDGLFQGTFDVNVNEAAYPFQVTGIHDIPTALIEGTEFYFTDLNIDVIDQYGRPINYETISDSYFDVIFWAEDDAESMIADYEPHGDEYLIATLKDGIQGSDTLYFGIYNDGLGDVAPESIYSFTAQCVGIEDLASFSLDVVADLLSSNDAEWNNYDQILFNWAKLYAEYLISTEFETGPEPPIFFEGPFEEFYTPYGSPFLFRAYLEDGTEVYVEFYSEDFVDIFTFTVENIELTEPMSFKYPMDPTVVAFDEVEGSCIAKAWINGEMVASTTFEISKADPAVASITAKSDSYDISLFDDFDIVDDEDFFAQFIYMMESGEDFFWDEFFFDGFMDSEIGFFILSQFDIVDQFGVELPWETLYMMEEINIITNYIETEDGLDVIVTVMTPDGVYYDSIRFTNIDNMDNN